MSRKGIHRRSISDRVKEKYNLGAFIAMGTNTIVYEDKENSNKVIMLTRDHSKFELLERMQKNDEIGEFYTDGNNVKGLKDIAVLVGRSEKLYPLTDENKRFVRKAVKEVNELVFQFRLRNSKGTWGAKPHQETEILEHVCFGLGNAVLYDEYPSDYAGLRLSEKTREIFEPACLAMQLMDSSRIYFDVSLRNFMQDKDGNIVCNDVIHDRQLFNVLAQRVELLPQYMRPEPVQNIRYGGSIKGIDYDVNHGQPIYLGLG